MSETDAEPEKEPEPEEPEEIEEPTEETTEVEPSEVSEEDLDAEVLFQVSHYNKEYGGPASLADVAFEIEEKDTDVHKAMMDAVERGTPRVKPVLKQLEEDGYIVETEYGGYVTTPEGDALIGEPEVQSELGSTYESQKHRGQPEGAEGEYAEEEMGVPFLNET